MQTMLAQMWSHFTSQAALSQLVAQQAAPLDPLLDRLATEFLQGQEALEEAETSWEI